MIILTFDVETVLSDVCFSTFIGTTIRDNDDINNELLNMESNIIDSCTVSQLVFTLVGSRLSTTKSELNYY
jgi:hypothetical protein